MKLTTKKLVYIAVFAALTAVLAPFSIPGPGAVPISLATFAVMLSGLILGPWAGALSQLIYVLLGAVGVPVFSGFSGGLGKLAGPTGGYIIGYLFLAFLCGLIYGRLGRKKQGAAKYAVMVAAMLVGTAVLYLFGTLWFMHLMEADLATALSLCVIPFLPGDAIKIAVAALIVPRLEKPLAKQGFPFFE